MRTLLDQILSALVDPRGVHADQSEEFTNTLHPDSADDDDSPDEPTQDDADQEPDEYEDDETDEFYEDDTEADSEPEEYTDSEYDDTDESYEDDEDEPENAESSNVVERANGSSLPGAVQPSDMEFFDSSIAGLLGLACAIGVGIWLLYASSSVIERLVATLFVVALAGLLCFLIYTGVSSSQDDTGNTHRSSKRKRR